MAPLPTIIAGRSQQIPPTQIPTLDTAQPASEPSLTHKIHYLEPGVQEDANYQVQWSNWMSDGQQNSFYKHVFVLLLSWHPECDDMAVGDEVQRLKEVLEDDYKYNVLSVFIDSRLNTLPQIQANQAVANFVAQNDDEDTLFIVYYAGHGSPGKDPGDLKMSGRRRQEKQKVAQQFSHITWNLVESNLKTTRADVFLIFDCCYASDLGRESVLTSRSFEYLAASTSTYTRSPGEQSFTSALIWAFRKLARQPSKADPQATPMFTTSKLAKMICDCPAFPRDQKPSLTTRDIDAWQHIILSPLSREGVPAPAPAQNDEHEDEDEEEDEDDKPIPQFLNLTFHFKQKQTETELKKLADHLKKFMKLDNTSLHKVQWGGIWGGWRPPRGHRFREVVGKVMAHAQSPVSRLKNSTFPSGLFQSERLSPQMSHHPSHSSTEREPLLSDTSSVTLEEEATARSLWSRLSSFCRSLWNSSLAEPQVQPNGETSNRDRKVHKKWTSRLINKLRIFFKLNRSSIMIQISS